MRAERERERERERQREKERRKGGREKDQERSFSDKPLVLLDQGPSLMTSFNLNYLLKNLASKAVTLGLRTSTCEWGSTRESITENKYGDLLTS